MDFTHYTDAAVQTAADLVNSIGSTTGNEYLGTPEAVHEFMEAHEISHSGRVTQEDVAELHRLRERLRAAFEAPGEAETSRILNELIAETETTPRLTNHDGDWHFHYTPDEASLGRRVATITAMGLAMVIAQYGRERFGICAADSCKDVFVDMSRNRSRRYCNEICSTRMNVAAYRTRHRRPS